MANKMLIDASHPEETRVVVIRGNKVQEFDFEAADKKPLRGNIYLAKVTRVEPSLQAAFIDYGGNRHGFLAFAEIHPDYYQIPVADRIALLEEESRAHRQAEEDEHRPQQAHGNQGQGQGRGRRSRRRHGESAEKRAAADDSVIFENAEPAPEGADQPLAHDYNEASVDDAQLNEVAASVALDGETAVSDETAVPTAVEEPVADSAEEPAAANENDDSAAGEEPVAPPQVEASHETIVVDPSGYGVVEEGGPEAEPVEALEPDHEAKARRQDERDEEHEREVEERNEQRSGEREQARKSPSPDDEHEDDEEHDDEADHVEHIGGDAMDEAPYRAPRPRRQYKI